MKELRGGGKGVRVGEGVEKKGEICGRGEKRVRTLGKWSRKGWGRGRGKGGEEERGKSGRSGEERK